MSHEVVFVFRTDRFGKDRNDSLTARKSPQDRSLFLLLRRSVGRPCALFQGEFRVQGWHDQLLQVSRHGSVRRRYIQIAESRLLPYKRLHHKTGNRKHPREDGQERAYRLGHVHRLHTRDDPRREGAGRFHRDLRQRRRGRLDADGHIPGPSGEVRAEHHLRHLRRLHRDRGARRRDTQRRVRQVPFHRRFSRLQPGDVEILRLRLPLLRGDLYNYPRRPRQGGTVFGGRLYQEIYRGFREADSRYRGEQDLPQGEVLPG